MIRYLSGSTSKGPLSRTYSLPLHSHFHHGTVLKAGSSSRITEFRDEAIKAKKVRLVDPESGSLSPSIFQTKTLLQQIDRKRFWVVQVKAQNKHQEQESNKEEEGLDEVDIPLEDMAIVKLVDKKGAYDKQKAQKKANASSSASSESLRKEVMMSWSSTPHDIQHKLTSVKTHHLMRRGPGAQCTIVILSKKGKGREGGMPQEDKQKLVHDVEEFLCDWEDHNEAASEPSRPSCYARRRGDVEWKGKGSMAKLVVEVIRSGK